MIVVLFASRSTAAEEIGEWHRRFERYAKTGGQTMRILAANSQNLAWADALPDSDELAVLWDVSGKMPPKEIEILGAELPARMWRFGVRFAGSPATRGVGSGRRLLGRIWGDIRRAVGKISDPQPPSAVLSCADLRKLAPVLTKLPVDVWTSALAAQARREGRAVSEVPAMWAV